VYLCHYSSSSNKFLGALKGRLAFYDGEDKVKELFDDIDTDEDGSIELAELLRYFRIKETNEGMKISAKKFFQSLDVNRDDSISLQEFRQGLTEDRSPRSLLYLQLNKILEPEMKSGSITYNDLSELVKALTTKTTRNAGMVKGSQDALYNQILSHPEINLGQKQYLDRLNDKTEDELQVEKNFLDIAISYCEHLFVRAKNLETDNEDCILKDFLKFKTGEFEEQSKKRKLVGK
jgi:Ca2+-binding EF-hand superfamily protein